jgi:hypothetical protein
MDTNAMESTSAAPSKPAPIGFAADHGGYELKEYLVKVLRGAGHAVIDFGDGLPSVDDDYPDFVIPLARAVAAGEVASPSVEAVSGHRLPRTRCRASGLA